MRTVVITGSARGFGFAMTKLFREANYNTVICDVSEENLAKAKEELETIKSQGKVLSFKADVTKSEDIQNVIDGTVKEFKTIDIWINNAGVNQPMKPIWTLDEKTINRLVDIDLKGAINGSRLVNQVMIKQKHGYIYNIEGFGSDDAKILGLSIYGTSKRAVTYFTEALAFENYQKNTGVVVGKITPGIMITNFTTTALGDGEHIELSDKTKNVYNILGDKPETIAAFMVKKMLKEHKPKKKGVKFMWLTNARAFRRFMVAWKYKDRYYKTSK